MVHCTLPDFLYDYRCCILKALGCVCQEKKNIQNIYVSAELGPYDARLYPYTKGLYSTDDDLKLFTSRQFVYNTCKKIFGNG